MQIIIRYSERIFEKFRVPTRFITQTAFLSEIITFLPLQVWFVFDSEKNQNKPKNRTCTQNEERSTISCGCRDGSDCVHERATFWLLICKSSWGIFGVYSARNGNPLVTCILWWWGRWNEEISSWWCLFMMFTGWYKTLHANYIAPSLCCKVVGLQRWAWWIKWWKYATRNLTKLTLPIIGNCHIIRSPWSQFEERSRFMAAKVPTFSRSMERIENAGAILLGSSVRFCLLWTWIGYESTVLRSYHAVLKD